MNISSLIKVFGMGVAGFVSQAQANPFGISFAKVDPPKDKKEEAICFRLKLSQTDVFSEHNFTDITFRPDTTVFLQKNMVIDDEEEFLKKTFKNFNAERDPFEIPDKHLPLEDKDRTKWVDKDGKPLKFLVVFGGGGSKGFPGNAAFLGISGDPKQPVFLPRGDVTFLGAVDCVLPGCAIYPNCRIREFTARGVISQQNIGCMLVKGNSLNLKIYKGTQYLLYTDGNFFQAYHIPTESYYKGKNEGTEIESPYFIFRKRHACDLFGLGIFRWTQSFRGKVTVILYFDVSTKGYRDYLEPKLEIAEPSGEMHEQIFDVAYKTREEVFMLTSIENPDSGCYLKCSFDVKDDFKGKKWAHGETKQCADVNVFALFFPEVQAQPNE